MSDMTRRRRRRKVEVSGRREKGLSAMCVCYIIYVVCVKYKNYVSIATTSTIVGEAELLFYYSRFELQIKFPLRKDELNPQLSIPKSSLIKTIILNVQ